MVSAEQIDKERPGIFFVPKVSFILDLFSRDRLSGLIGISSPIGFPDFFGLRRSLAHGLSLINLLTFCFDNRVCSRVLI